MLAKCAQNTPFNHY